VLVELARPAPISNNSSKNTDGRSPTRRSAWSRRRSSKTGTSEMLRIISNSPIQSVLDAVAENAARLCESNNAEIFRLENNLLRLVASYGAIPVAIHAREGLPANRDRVMGRATCDRRTIHVHDLAAEDSEYPVGSSDAKREGHRTTLATPLLREGTTIGVILVRRWEVRPFNDKQIALLETFAGQAVIAIENVRLFEAERERTLALVHANRDLAEREAKIRRLVEANIIGIFIWDVDGRIIEANDSFLDLVQYNREDLVSGRVRWTDLTPEEWQDDTARRVAEVMSTGAAQPREKEYFRRDGSRVPVLIGGAALDERPDRGIAFVVDLTERKRAEEALRQSTEALRRSEAYLAEAQRLSHTGTWVSDGTLTTVYNSDENYRIWGVDPLRAFRAAMLCGNASTQTIEAGYGKGSKRQCARKETTRASSESCCRMEQSSISTSPPIIGSPRAVRLSRFSVPTSMCRSGSAHKTSMRGCASWSQI
jgi:PAS domain S-box-containing protein